MPSVPLRPAADGLLQALSAFFAEENRDEKRLRKVSFAVPGRSMTIRMTAAATRWTTRLRMIAAVGLLLTGVLAPLATPAGASPGTTERVSVDSAGTQGNSFSLDPSISADGRFVAFSSLATNLVPGDTNGAFDVFVHDRLTGTTERVSVDSAGTQGHGNSSEPSISADGRFVAFSSVATNRVPGDTNAAFDVFVHDRLTGTTERVSVASAGTQGNGSSLDPSISADGRFVAFSSVATNLVPGDTNGKEDVFVHDRLT